PSSSDPHVSLVADAIQLFNRVLDRSRELEKQLEEERAARNRAELRAYAAFQELERVRRNTHGQEDPATAFPLGATTDSVLGPSPHNPRDMAGSRRVRVGMRDTGEGAAPIQQPQQPTEATFGLKFRKWLLGY